MSANISQSLPPPTHTHTHPEDLDWGLSVSSPRMIELQPQAVQSGLTWGSERQVWERTEK